MSAGAGARPRQWAADRAWQWAGMAAASFRLQLRATSWLSILIAASVQPAAYALITLSAYGSQGPAPQGLVLGSGLLGAWTVTLWQAGMVLRREFWSGTLPAICSRDAGLPPVLIGKTLASVGLSVSVTIVSVAAVAAARGQMITVERPAAFVAALGLSLLTTLPLGLLVSCLFLLTRAAIRIAEALVYPVFIVGGLIVPLDVLPHWLRPVSGALNLRWGRELLTGAAQGHMDQRAWIGLCVTGLVYTAVARLMFARVLHRARREGSLEVL